jgi:lysophospholipase L1-like esterase
MTRRRAIHIVLCLSIAANFLFLSLGIVFLHRHGGMPYLKNRLSTGVELRHLNTDPNSPPRRSLFDTLARPTTGPTIVFLGDSLTQICEWRELLGMPVINRGIDSDTTADILDRLDAVLALRPQAVFLMVGINDIAQHMDAKVTVQNYSQIISRIHASNPNTIVYLQSVLPTRFHGNEMNRQVRALNQEISNLADNKTFIFVDLYHSFLQGDEMSPDLSVNDGVHLNGAGYEVWKTNIMRFLTVRAGN